MAGIDPYGPCPCGSGQKFKWCCQKMEAVADKAQRLYEGNQVQVALETLDEGLKKEPANAWLLIRKSLIQVREGMADEAKVTLRTLLSRQPQHVGGLSLLARAVLETEGPLAGIAEIQRALAALSTAERPGLASMVAITGTLLARIGHYQSALAHLQLARRMTVATGVDERVSSVETSILENAAVLPWLKTTYRPSPAPAGLDPERARRFDEALGWVEAGLWSSAGPAFDVLSADLPGPEADRNVGLCRLWQADDRGAVEALRRAIRKLGPTDEAVDLEALCQIIEPPRAPDKVEEVQLIWPLKNREALLATLKASREVGEDEAGPIDPNDPESPEVDRFLLLDRPALPPGDGTGLKVADVPRVVGRLAVGREIVALEGYDGGGLDALSDRFRAMAGGAIPPAHPKTKRIGSIPRVSLALSWEPYLPAEVDPAESRRLSDEQQARLIREVWPETKMPYLGGRTPRQAAKAGDAVVPLRAAACQFERQQELSRSPLDLDALRATLGIPPEPEVDPGSVDAAALPFARFAYVPADRLADDTLIGFFQVARLATLVAPATRAARALAGRPALLGSGKIPPLSVYSELAHAATIRGSLDEALRLVDEGRRAEPAADRARTAPNWDVLVLTLRARMQEPEAWVPELAILMDRYRDNQAANQVLMVGLLELGLLRMVPNPDNPQDVMIDPRPLQALLAEYGPRVTTASGTLGVAATRPAVWTPGSETGAAPGAIWTPGSGSGAPSPAPAAPGEPNKPRLIIPGR